MPLHHYIHDWSIRQKKKSLWLCEYPAIKVTDPKCKKVTKQKSATEVNKNFHTKIDEKQQFFVRPFFVQIILILFSGFKYIVSL